MTAAESTIFVSRAGADGPMAAEVGRILEASGYNVILQQWDFANQNFMAKMHEAIAGGARVVALLSPSIWRAIIVPRNGRTALRAIRSIAKAV